MVVRNQWNQYTLKPNCTYLTRRLFVPVTTRDIDGDASNIYDHAKFRDGQTDEASAIMIVPDDFVSLVSVKALVYSDTTGNIRWGGSADLAAEGENIWIHDYSIPPSTSSITDTETLFALDMTAGFSAMAVGDFVGFDIYRQGNHAEDTLPTSLFLVGFVIEYIASQ